MIKEAQQVTNPDKVTQPKNTIHQLFQTTNTRNDLMEYILILSSILIVAIIIQTGYKKYKELKTKQGIRNKLIFSHGELLNNLSIEENNSMRATLQNTYKNTMKPTNLQRYNLGSKEKNNKSVKFIEESNAYYEPGLDSPTLNKYKIHQSIIISPITSIQDTRPPLSQIYINSDKND